MIGWPCTPGELWARRVAISVSRETLAELIPCHPNTLRFWETETYVPSTAVLNVWRRELVRLEVDLAERLLDLHPWLADNHLPTLQETA